VTNALGISEDQMLEEISDAISSLMSNYHETFWKHRKDMALRIIPSDTRFGFRIEALPQLQSTAGAEARA